MNIETFEVTDFHERMYLHYREALDTHNYPNEFHRRFLQNQVSYHEEKYVQSSAGDHCALCGLKNTDCDLKIADNNKFSV